MTIKRRPERPSGPVGRSSTLNGKWMSVRARGNEWHWETAAARSRDPPPPLFGPGRGESSACGARSSVRPRLLSEGVLTSDTWQWQWQWQ